MMTGCASSMVLPPQIEQQNLLRKFPDTFTDIVSEKTGDAWTRSSVLRRAQYEECSATHNALVDALRNL